MKIKANKTVDKKNNIKNNDNSGEKNKKSIWRRVRVGAFAFLFALTSLIGIAFGGISLYLNGILESFAGSDGSADPNFNEKNITTFSGLSDQVKNIAVFGVDTRSDEDSGSRSDAMMIVSFDMKHNKVKAVSVMRDSLVEIPGYGKRKINSSYSLGNVELAINTLNHNFDMNITDYIVLNFNQLANIVDTLGGVEVEISEAERRNANKYIKEMAAENGHKPDLIEEAGTVTLYGYQAVSYARIRAVGNADFERTERQREVMEKLMNKALSAGISKYSELADDLFNMMKTSLSKSEVKEMMWYIIGKGAPTFEQGRFPIDGTYSTNQYYAMTYDMEEAADKLHRFIYDDEPFYEE